MRAGVERLQKLRGAHGFSQAKDTVGMVLRGEELEPLVSVVAFDEAVGGERSAAGAVSACVREKNTVAAREQELSVAGHADAVVAEAVEQDHSVSVGVARMDGPGMQGDGVGCGDGDVFKIGDERAGGFDHGGFFILGERTARGVESTVGDPDSCHGAEGEIEKDRESEAAGSAGKAHE